MPTKRQSRNVLAPRHGLVRIGSNAEAHSHHRPVPHEVESIHTKGAIFCESELAESPARDGHVRPPLIANIKLLEDPGKNLVVIMTAGP